MNRPHHWNLITLTDGEETATCIFGGWSGGFGDSDEWRRSTPLKTLEIDGDLFRITTESGSEYVLHKHGEGLRGYAANILAGTMDSNPGKIKVISMEDHLKAQKDVPKELT